LESLEHSISLTLPHRVFFTRRAFASGNDVLGPLTSDRVLVLVDAGVAAANHALCGEITAFFSQGGGHRNLVRDPVVMSGGEACKNDWSLVESLWALIHETRIDRHSTILCIGGGAFLDLVGFAAATAHRGIRLVRMPTTTLSQGDGGIGVKNGVNFFGKKNWVGTFAVPWAVVNDLSLLESLPPREKRAGLIEGIKVAVLRDAPFFREMERRAGELAALAPEAVEFVVHRSAALHLDHIATGGDPFELGSARPLDFGHWVAHRIEPSSGYRIRHGEAVAIGMAVDLVYARLAGLLAAADCERILALMQTVGFRIYDSEIERRGASGEWLVWRGLEDFREHLGGELTITLVTGIGSKIEVHHVEQALVIEAMAELRARAG
jgi:3-dehydroquinate synthase